MRWILLLVSVSFSANAQQSYLIDWDEVGEESLDHLVELIQINSTKTYALDQSRANLVARAVGNGSKRPLLIMGHTDVVGVQPDKWYADPFSGLRQDGFVYGRGTLDDKDNLAAGLMVMKLLKRYDVELDRDVILLAESGEEGTPEVGINFMVEKHFDVIDAEYCLAEGGQKVIEDDKVVTVGIGTTEKMPRRVTLLARGTPGHGSKPTLTNAVVILANAVAKAGAWETEVRFNETTRTYFQRLAEISSPEDAWRYNNIEDPEESAAIQAHFLETASAILDIRMLPDESVEEFYAKLAAVIDDPRVEIVPEHIYRPAAPPSEIDNEMFQILERVAATDMAQVRAMGMQAYGIGPARSVEEMNSGFGAHGDNERISEEAFVELVKYMWNVVIEVAATR